MTGVVERALQLAGSGECRTLGDIHQRLRREQFTQIPEHLAGRSIKAQLNQLMADAQLREAKPGPAEKSD